MTAVVQESAAADLVNASEAAEVVNFLSGQWNFIKSFYYEASCLIFFWTFLVKVIKVNINSFF